MPRRTFTANQKRRLVERFDRSQLSAAAYCRKHHLCYSSFLNWKRAADTSTSKKRTPAVVRPQFVEVEVSPTAVNSQVPCRSASFGSEPLAELVIGPDIALRVFGRPSTRRPQ